MVEFIDSAGGQVIGGTLATVGSIGVGNYFPSRHTQVAGAYDAIWMSTSNSGIIGETTSGFKAVNLSANAVRANGGGWQCQDTTRNCWIVATGYEASANGFAVFNAPATAGSASFSELFAVRTTGTNLTNLTASGTVTVDTLMVGGASGPLLRNNAGTIEVRNNANSALANMSASQFTASFFRDSTNQANYFGAGIHARNTWILAYSNDGTDFGTKDLSFSRNAAGVLQIGNGTANASGSLLLTNLTASGTVRLGTYTVATLPSAASNTRALAFVTDSSVGTFGSIVASGGALGVTVYSDGANWLVSGGSVVPQKAITSGTAAPTGGVDGDIYLQYV
jgi:hypothetical protein